MSRDVASFIIAPSAARGDYTGTDIQNPSYRGARFYFDVTAAGSTLAFPTFKVQGKIPGTTASYKTLFTLTGTTVQVQTMTALICPGVSTASTIYTDVRSDFLPKVWRITSTNATTASVTWSAGVDLIG